MCDNLNWILDRRKINTFRELRKLKEFRLHSPLLFPTLNPFIPNHQPSQSTVYNYMIHSL